MEIDNERSKTFSRVTDMVNFSQTDAVKFNCRPASVKASYNGLQIHRKNRFFRLPHARSFCNI